MYVNFQVKVCEIQLHRSTILKPAQRAKLIANKIT